MWRKEWLLEIIFPLSSSVLSITSPKPRLRDGDEHEVSFLLAPLMNRCGVLNTKCLVHGSEDAEMGTRLCSSLGVNLSFTVLSPELQHPEVIVLMWERLQESVHNRSPAQQGATMCQGAACARVPALGGRALPRSLHVDVVFFNSRIWIYLPWVRYILVQEKVTCLDANDWPCINFSLFIGTIFILLI